MTRFVEGDRLDDATQLIVDHSWQAAMPNLSADQLAELLPVLLPWYREELARPKAKPSVRRPAPKVDRGSQQSARALVAARSGGLCEVCSIAAAREWHHRKNRSQGGRWSAANGLYVCTPDHAWITEHPEQARRNGWAVPGSADPAEVPVLRRGLLVMLDDEGGVSAVEEGGAA